MERRSGEVEDLPPLRLSPLRELDLEAAPSPGRPAHLSAASGVVRRGDHVYVIGDDQLALGVFRLTVPGPGRLAPALRGRLPDDADARAEEKPDLEALTVLPPFAGHPFGALLGLGSGSQPGRDRGFTWALDADGSLRDDPREIVLGPVYARLRRRAPHLNVEGACVMGDRLWLLNRGGHPDSPNLVAELSLREVMDSITGDGVVDTRELLAVRAYDLGELDGVPLAFSDATPLGDGVLVFTASAEAHGEGRDGAIRGSVVGTLDRAGDVRRLRTIDRRYKVEGVHASIDTGVVDLLFVCDQDDPELASPLLAAAMPLDGRVEYQG
jgi:hypothetical protein